MRALELGAVLVLFFGARIVTAAPPAHTFTNSIGVEFVLIEPGHMQVAVFQPSCPSEKDFPPEIAPAFRWTAANYAACAALVKEQSSPGFPVTIERPFYIGKFEITQAQFRAVMERNPSAFQGAKVSDDAGRHPVEQVSWDDTQAFVARLNAREHTRAYRLPTEFEWEYAGRAGSRGQVDWDVIRKQAVQGRRAKPGEAPPTTSSVGSREPNAWGLYDMLGNVWEWVQDFYNEKTFPDPVPPASGTQHVLKGAGFASDVKNAIYATHAAGPGDGWDVGFRIVMDVPPSSDGDDPVQEASSPGQTIYTRNCSFCHGPGARGGSQGGPDLATSPIVRNDTDGQQLGAFLKVGRPAKGMPAFQLSESEVKTLAGFLHSVVRASTASPEFGKDILVGDAAAGKQFFEGAGGCTHCHSAQGDLKGIGAKYPPLVLQGRLVLPRGHGGYPGFEAKDPSKDRVTITFPDGRSQSGTLIFLSDYYVTFVDASGGRHTVSREGATPKVTVEDPLEAHLKLEEHLADREMHDLTAYLASLR